MKLGIIINTDRHLADIMGIVNAAIFKKHEVILFNMDEGTKLVVASEFAELSKTKGITMSFCSHSAKHFGIGMEGIPEKIVSGSQYNNALMVNAVDRVIIL